MKDRDVLKNRKWSIVRVTQLAAVLIFTLFTVMMTVPFAHPTENGLSDHTAHPFLVRVYMLTIYPAVELCNALGIRQGQAWLWILPVAVNAVLGMIAGTLAGCALSLVFGPKATRKRSSDYEQD